MSEQRDRRKDGQIAVRNTVSYVEDRITASGLELKMRKPINYWQISLPEWYSQVFTGVDILLNLPVPSACLANVVA